MICYILWNIHLHNAKSILVNNIHDIDDFRCDNSALLVFLNAYQCLTSDNKTYFKFSFRKSLRFVCIFIMYSFDLNMFKASYGYIFRKKVTFPSNKMSESNYIYFEYVLNTYVQMIMIIHRRDITDIVLTLNINRTFRSSFDFISAFFCVWYWGKLILFRDTNYCFIRLHIYIVSKMILKIAKNISVINVNMVNVGQTLQVKYNEKQSSHSG